MFNFLNMWKNKNNKIHKGNLFYYLYITEQLLINDLIELKELQKAGQKQNLYLLGKISKAKEVLEFLSGNSLFYKDNDELYDYYITNKKESIF